MELEQLKQALIKYQEGLSLAENAVNLSIQKGVQGNPNAEDQKKLLTLKAEMAEVFKKAKQSQDVSKEVESLVKKYK